MNKRGLEGAGRSRPLISTKANESFEEIALIIQPNPYQPRRLFSQQALDELATSIRAGIIQPIVVRRIGDSYELIAGERRWRAASQAGLATIPAIVREATDSKPGARASRTSSGKI